VSLEAIEARSNRLGDPEPACRGMPRTLDARAGHAARADDRL